MYLSSSYGCPKRMLSLTVPENNHASWLAYDTVKLGSSVM